MPPLQSAPSDSGESGYKALGNCLRFLRCPMFEAWPENVSYEKLKRRVLQIRASIESLSNFNCSAYLNDPEPNMGKV